MLDRQYIRPSRQYLMLGFGLLMLGGCASAFGPPGKSQMRLNSENATCSRRAQNSEFVYAECMLNFGNTVRLSDGRIFEPQHHQPVRAPSYQPPPPMAYQPPASEPPTYQTPPSPAYEPPPYQPSAAPPKISPPVASPIAPSPPPAAPSGSLTSEQERVLKTLEVAAGHAALSCGSQAVLRRILKQESHGIRCFVITTLTNSYRTLSLSDIKSAICSNPHSLERIPLVTAEIAKGISDEIGCYA